MKRLSILFSVLLVLTGLLIGGLRWNLLPTATKIAEKKETTEKIRILQEENVVIDVAEKVSPSVVTIGIIKQQQVFNNPFSIDPFDPFGILGQPLPQQGTTKKIEQDIGTGFIVSKDGLIVTNKHVVADTEAKYKVMTKDDKTYNVEKIYRDPINDLAILKISASDLRAIEMGDSSNLKVGQFVIAIGTALGEFRHTVTTGVVSGLGRGITAGSPFSGSERLDNVIQTDAAINPGNSGGPLLNSAGQVIGVSVAVAQGGQNIGFALPINVVKESLKQFNESGQFYRPYLGIKYKMIGRDLALLNDLPEGAYVQEVVENSPAQKAGIQSQDIITKIDGVRLTEKDGEVTAIIAKRKVGDKLKISLWRRGKELEKEAILEEWKE